MTLVANLPLFLVVFLIYNGVALSGPQTLAAPLFEITLLSGARWVFAVSDLLITLSLLTLYIEILKSTRSSAQSILDHTFSTLVFVACLVEFIAYGRAANSTFFFITLMTFVDVVAGFTVTIATARRDIGFDR